MTSLNFEDITSTQIIDFEKIIEDEKEYLEKEPPPLRRTKRKEITFDNLKNIDLDEEFTTLQVLGRGSFGVVYHVREKDTGLDYALKMIKLGVSANIGESTVEEYKTMKGLQPICHQGLACYHDIFKTTVLMKNYICIKMEYIDGVDLDEYIKAVDGPSPIKNEYFLKLIKHLSRILDLLHSKGFVHRDIKAANIRYNSKTRKIVLVDYGGLCSISECKGIYGTPSYFSPEIRAFLSEKQKFKSEYLFSSDVWAMGVVFFLLATGKFPYQPSVKILIQPMIEKTKLPTDEIGKLINDMLIVDSGKRITSSELYKNLRR